MGKSETVRIEGHELKLTNLDKVLYPKAGFTKAHVLDCCDVALWLREALEALSLQSFAKTSGSKGMQLYVPLNTPTTFDETKPFARALGEVVEQEHPERVTTRMIKTERPGKVFIDWSQNDEHKTTVCAYSLRAKE